MKALIDADSLVYKVACAIEEVTFWNECEYEVGLEEEKQVTYNTDLSVAYNTVEGLIDNILFATECDDYELHLTGNHNFRYDNPLGYKEHRVDLRKPLGFYELRDYLVTTHNAVIHNGIEADDIVVYLKTKYPEDYLLCAIDKDVLYQTVGTHYNYGNDTIVTVKEHEALRFMYYQALVGDVTDGYKGCKGIGKVKAAKVLDEIIFKMSMTLKEYEVLLYKKTLETFEKCGHNEEYLINTLRLASMHQFDGKNVVYFNSPLASV